MTKKVQVNKTDKFGSVLSKGDEVIFAKGGQELDVLYIGVIIELGTLDNYTIVEDVNLKTTRTNKRLSSDLILLKPYKDAHPEYFI